MDEALGWLMWLEPEERRLVWLRAEGLPWKWITRRLGIGRTTAWQRWTIALLKIAVRLNAAAEQNRPNIKPLNRRSRFCARKSVASDEVRAPPARPRRAVEPARHGRGGFCCCGVAVALEAARAPSAGGEERGGGEAGAGPRAAERSAPGLRSPLAPGPGCLPRPPPAVRAVPGGRAALVPATVVDHVVPHRGDPRPVLGRGELAGVVQALP